MMFLSTFFSCLVREDNRPFLPGGKILWLHRLPSKVTGRWLANSVPTFLLACDAILEECAAGLGEIFVTTLVTVARWCSRRKPTGAWIRSHHHKSATWRIIHCWLPWSAGLGRASGGRARSEGGRTLWRDPRANRGAARRTCALREKPLKTAHHANVAYLRGGLRYVALKHRVLRNTEAKHTPVPLATNMASPASRMFGTPFANQRGDLERTVANQTQGPFPEPRAAIQGMATPTLKKSLLKAVQDKVSSDAIPYLCCRPEVLYCRDWEIKQMNWEQDTRVSGIRFVQWESQLNQAFKSAHFTVNSLYSGSTTCLARRQTGFDFLQGRVRIFESGHRVGCRTMPLVGGFSRGSPIFPAFSFRCCSILTSLPRHHVMSRPNIFTSLLISFYIL
ncbi:hypothetical protein PR048_023943 [Dryococelus australis]|uniref:Uncharacterized protein n=1 Tax=Dryococelus australis TaxID=614101 RepID=A0ABQ9GVH8_9NEOP|nr:hypothetical protein PR048_023943 [Dryococelus australis]